MDIPDLHSDEFEVLELQRLPAPAPAPTLPVQALPPAAPMLQAPPVAGYYIYVPPGAQPPQIPLQGDVSAAATAARNNVVAPERKKPPRKRRESKKAEPLSLPVQIVPAR